jgi:hypothetical protein
VSPWKANRATLLDTLEDEEQRQWYALTPAERFAESQRLWATFLLLGGSCEPEPDSQSPLYVPTEEVRALRWGKRHPLRSDGVHGRRFRRRGGAWNLPARAALESLRLADFPLSAAVLQEVTLVTSAASVRASIT